MRQLLDNSDDTDVNKLVGIALGAAGGVIIITGILWFLYRRYAGLGGSLAGIPPERKMLVFTDLGRIPDSTQRSPSRPFSARPPSRGVPRSISGLTRTAPQSPRPTGRPTSAGRPSASLLPALSVGLEPEPVPNTPGSISSPRGHGRSIFSTMDHPRSSHTGAPTAGPMDVLGGGGPGGSASGDSRPGSAAGPSGQQMRGQGSTLEGSERPGSGGRRPSSAGAAAAAAAAASGSRGRATSALAAISGGGGGGGGNALPPALVPTGSVTTAWRGPVVPELAPERSLNSVAGAMSAVEPFESPRLGTAAAAGPLSEAALFSAGGGSGSAAVAAAGTFSAGASGRPPLPGGRSSISTGLGAPSSAAATAMATAPGNASQVGPSRVSWSRPGSGGAGGADAGSGGGAGGGGGATSSGAGPSWPRPSGVRTPRTSQGVGRLSSTGVADDTVSNISGASSQFHSFSHAGEDTGGGGGCLPPHQQQHDGQGGAPSAAAAAAVAAAAAHSQQRSRLGAGSPGVNTSVTSSQASVTAVGAAEQPAGQQQQQQQQQKQQQQKQQPEPPRNSINGAAAAAPVAVVTPSRVSASSYMTPPRLLPQDGEAAAAVSVGLAERLSVEPEAVGAGGATDGGGGRPQGLPLEPAVPGGAAGHGSPTQTAWAAAVSLSSKLFGRSTRSQSQSQSQEGLATSSSGRVP